LEIRGENLVLALGLKPREHLAVVGGGGKSTLCLALATVLRQNGAKVISTTTTKVWRKEANAFPRVLLLLPDGQGLEAVRKGVRQVGNIFVGREFLENGKVDGIPMPLADDLFRETSVEYVIIEADGAAGRPVKTPAAHEPVIPESVTGVIAVMGLGALGKPLGPDIVFRLDLFKALTGLEEGGILDSEGLARAFDVRAGLFKNTPVSARQIAFLNQLDNLPDENAACELAQRLIRTQPSIERVVMASLRNKKFITIRPEKAE